MSTPLLSPFLSLASYQTPEAFGELASKKGGLHVIEIISATMEIILSASSTSDGTVLCVHAKVMAGSSSVSVTVRSTDQALSQRLCDFFARSLSK